MGTNGAPAAGDLVNITIDGQPLQVKKGTNLIEAAKQLYVDIPYYCYHPNLSIAGNCRMCQVEVKGAPKLEIACNTLVREGMEVSTHLTSEKARDAQAATLEFILINHPLDCTVCDQAGHCKLQDYHYEYNAKPSRFLENKEHKVKAEPLGPTVMLDGERCIMCTRCVRFCDEVTKTSELGMLNRGDRSVIAINPGRELSNPLSGTVVDLCPVGALTHKHWRFNTRIWFTSETDSICPGCSTGCNVKVAERDGMVVQVKGRANQEVNKEWLCDEGRYGFQRFLPEKRLTSVLVDGKEDSRAEAIKRARGLVSDSTAVFISPDLLLEEYLTLKSFLDKTLRGYRAVVAYRERKLTPVEAILISPDYACNFRGAEFAGLVSGSLEESYSRALQELSAGNYKSALFVGDRAVLPGDQKSDLLHAISRMDCSIGLLCDAEAPLTSSVKTVFPARSILEKSGLLINRKLRLQYNAQVLEFPDGADPHWRTIAALGESFSHKLTQAITDRDLTLEWLKAESRLAGFTIKKIKEGGVALDKGGFSGAPGAEAEARV